MIKYIKTFIKASFVGIALWSCESEADGLGSQFFSDNMAQGNLQSYDVVGYNVDNGDACQSDASKLTQATLGAFTEPVFGTQKSSYVTQVRLNGYNPTFTNAVIDSVVLVVKPLYSADSVTVTTNEDYTHSSENIAAKKVVKTYPIIGYGKTKKSMTLNVHEVDEFLGAATDTIYSNKNVSVGRLIGSKIMGSTVSSTLITKDDDNSELVNIGPGIRIPLDKDFFKSKILDRSSSTDLGDAANFIRYFKGIRISVAENDGYIFNFSPNEMEMIMYYKQESVSNSVTTMVNREFNFEMGSANVHFSQVQYNRSGTALASLGHNATTGDAKLYPQGMGGKGIGVKIPLEIIEQIRQQYKRDKISILSAKIRLYTDASTWNNSYRKPAMFTALSKDSSGFLDDMTAMASNAAYSLVKAHNLTENPAYYDISITQTFKNIIEKDAENKELILNVGSFETNSSNAMLGSNFTTNAYTPNRVVLVGTDASNDKRIRLNVIYTKK